MPMPKIVPFLAKGITDEGFPYAIAALFRDAPSASVPARFPFGPYRNGIPIDVRLVQFVQTCCSESLAAGATIHIPGAAAPCGGVAGDPGTPISSADNAIEHLRSGLSGFAVPGSISIIGNYTDDELSQLAFYARSAFSDSAVTRDRLKRLLTKMSALHKEALLISDGSGGQQGCAAVLTSYAEHHIFLEAPHGKHRHY